MTIAPVLHLNFFFNSDDSLFSLYCSTKLSMYLQLTVDDQDPSIYRTYVMSWFPDCNGLDNSGNYRKFSLGRGTRSTIVNNIFNCI